jgi:hypothetical protein
MQRSAAEHSCPCGNVASGSVQAAFHFIHHPVNGVALIIAVHEVVANAIIEGIDEASLQRGICNITPRG